ncbi:MAG: CHAT domain-containing protein, partial [Psychroserpens sp.]|nr:CHAT domain-containing protein [Psychroserpens sp.]
RSLSLQLGDLLIPDIDPIVSNLIINPDGVLAKIPFEILINDKGNLVDNYNIHYTSNLGFIMPNIETKNDSKLLAIYNPNYPNTSQKLVTRSAPVYLEGAQSEANLISEYFPAKLYNENLSKLVFKETAPKASLLHLAMHAVINPKNSGLNQLLFDSKVDSEKNLSLEEIYGMKLNADMAVLSACNTGFGNDNDGRGMESFQRAFTFAGVPSTVASLWEVPDQPTKDIMVDFYKNLKRGKTKSEALKDAKLKFRQDHEGTKLASPYYWAGFVLYGSDVPIIASSINSIWYITLLISLIVISWYFWKRKMSS